MTRRLWPSRADNGYHGYTLALWIFGLLVLMKTGISVSSIFNGYVAATIADGIPLDAYPAAAAQTVLALFALLGLANLVICLLGILVLARYRVLVPLMFALLLLYQLSRLVVLRFLPILRTGAPPGTIINMVMLGLMIAGLGLSLRNRGPAGAATAIS